MSSHWPNLQRASLLWYGPGRDFNGGADPCGHVRALTPDVALPDASSADKLTARADDQPAPAVLEHVLAEDLPGPRVADVVVEGPARVGDLAAAVRAPDGAEQGPLDAG